MTPFEQMLADSLPRPEMDQAFAQRLLLRIVSDQPFLTVMTPDPPSRFRIHHVGGVMGAVVLAVGAAIGLRSRGRGKAA